MGKACTPVEPWHRGARLRNLLRGLIAHVLALAGLILGGFASNVTGDPIDAQVGFGLCLLLLYGRARGWVFPDEWVLYRWPNGRLFWIRGIEMKIHWESFLNDPDVRRSFEQCARLVHRHRPTRKKKELRHE